MLLIWFRCFTHTKSDQDKDSQRERDVIVNKITETSQAVAVPN